LVEEGGCVATVGERLKEERLLRGWSQRDLAREAGTTAETISSIETGQHKPRPSTLRKLAKSLGIEVRDLFMEPVLSGKAEAPGTGHEEPPSNYVEISDEESERISNRIEDAVRHLLGLSEEDSIPEEATQELHEAFMGAVRRVAQSEIEQHLDEAFAEREEQIEKREAELWRAFDRLRAEERERREQDE
jgi:transcriptional regulator with XRE-family HTH domain